MVGPKMPPVVLWVRWQEDRFMNANTAKGKALGVFQAGRKEDEGPVS